MINTNVMAIISNKFNSKTNIINIFKEFGYKEINDIDINKKILSQTKSNIKENNYTKILTEYSFNNFYTKEVINDIDSQIKFNYIKYMNGLILEIRSPYIKTIFNGKYKIIPEFVIYNTGIQNYKDFIKRLFINK